MSGINGHLNIVRVHRTDCDFVQTRKRLTAAIQRAISPSGEAFAHLPADGSERALAVSFAVLRGVVAEYLDDGDQSEACDCV